MAQWTGKLSGLSWQGLAIVTKSGGLVEGDRKRPGTLKFGRSRAASLKFAS
jgi:hypothetical protein